MVVTNWLRLFRGRMWYQSRLGRPPRKRRRPIGLAQRIELFEDRTLLSAVAVDDTALVQQNVAAQIDVLANDYDVESGPLEIVGITQPAYGTVSIL
jgi:hypothetical protein